MALATELIQSRTTREEDGRKSTELNFRAEVTPDQIGTITNIPQIDDLLDWDATQRCVQRYAVYEPGSLSCCRIVVLFSTDHIDILSPNFKSWTLSYYDVTWDLIYAVRNPIGFRFPNAQGGTTVMPSYEVKSTPITETRKRFIRNVRIQNFYITQWEAVGAQTNYLHKIGNVWYRFTVGNIIEVRHHTWDVTYSWEFDPGTPNVPILDTPSIRWPRDFTTSLYPPALYTRPPFHTIYPEFGIADPGPPPVPGWPVFKVKQDYLTAETGWTLLPGMSL